MQIKVGVSIVDVLREYKEAERAADARVQEWQSKVKIGDCFKQKVSDCLYIYGEVIDEGLSKNWRESRCYSFACPRGEDGSVHVSQIDELIPRETFEKMKHILNETAKSLGFS